MHASPAGFILRNSIKILRGAGGAGIRELRTRDRIYPPNFYKKFAQAAPEFTNCVGGARNFYKKFAHGSARPGPF